MSGKLNDLDQMLQDYRCAENDDLDDALMTAAGLTRALYLLTLSFSEGRNHGIDQADPRDALAFVRLADAAASATSSAFVIFDRQPASRARTSPPRRAPHKD